MRVYRFMSFDEFQKYSNGEILENHKIHKETYAYSHSVGFCFLDFYDCSPDYAYEFLFGIVNNDILAIFEVSDNLLNLSEHNQYADPYGGYSDCIYVDEYCTESYSNKDFKLIKCLFSTNGDFNFSDLYDLY